MESQEQVILWIILTCTGLGSKPWQHLPRWHSHEPHCTAAFHLGQPTSLADERIWDIKYKRKPQTPKSQSISGLTPLSEHLLRKLCYQGRSKQGISHGFSVWVTCSPHLPPNESPKKFFFPFPSSFNSFTKCHIDFQGQRTATWHLRVRPSCFPLGKPQKDKMKRKAKSCFTKVTWNTGAAARGKGTWGLLSHSLCMSPAHRGTKNYRKQICL